MCGRFTLTREMRERGRRGVSWLLFVPFVTPFGPQHDVRAVGRSQRLGSGWVAATDTTRPRLRAGHDMLLLRRQHIFGASATRLSGQCRLRLRPTRFRGDSAGPPSPSTSRGANSTDKGYPDKKIGAGGGQAGVVETTSGETTAKGEAVTRQRDPTGDEDGALGTAHPTDDEEHADRAAGNLDPSTPLRAGCRHPALQHDRPRFNIAPTQAVVAAGMSRAYGGNRHQHVIYYRV